MAKQIIAIDIDDVIADSTEVMRRRVNKRTGANLEPQHYVISHPGYWGYYERVWREHRVDIAYDDLLEEMEADQAQVPLLPGAAFALSELSKKYDLVVITSRPSTWEAKTTEWLRSQIGNIFSAIYFAGSKDQEKTKGQICKELGARWLIDDNPEHCQSALDEGLKAVLFGEYGWHHNAPKHLITCKNWPELLAYFKGEGDEQQTNHRG